MVGILARARWPPLTRHVATRLLAERFESAFDGMVLETRARSDCARREARDQARVCPALEGPRRGEGAQRRTSQRQSSACFAAASRGPDEPSAGFAPHL